MSAPSQGSGGGYSGKGSGAAASTAQSDPFEDAGTMFIFGNGDTASTTATQTPTATSTATDAADSTPGGANAALAQQQPVIVNAGSASALDTVYGGLPLVAWLGIGGGVVILIGAWLIGRK